MQAFINVARHHLAVFSTALDFESDAWDVSEYVHLRAKGNNRLRLLFCSWSSANQLEPTSMAEPFKDFAKAYIRYMQGLRPTKILAQRLVALRALEAALVEIAGVADAMLTTGFILNRATQMIAARYAKSTAYRISRHLEVIADFMFKNHMMKVACRWRTFLVRTHDQNKVGAEFERRRRLKLPSQAALDALPMVFRAALAPAEIIFGSVAALLVSAPDRVSEVLTLDANCEVYEKGLNGEIAYGLRWFPAKGAEPMVKWIVPSMVPVVKEAVAKIRNATTAAREVARWYELNPTRVYLPAELEHFRSDTFLTKSEMVQLFNLASEDCVEMTCKTFDIVPLWRGRNWRVRFDDVEKSLLRHLPEGFPYLDMELGLRYSEALFVVRRNELHPRRGTNPSLIGSITTNQVNSALGGKVNCGGSSIFSRLGFSEKDGTPIRVSSNQFRHYLNTLAQMGGMGQLDIAKWSGRKDVRQNRVYDHMTTTQLLERARRAVGNESDMFGPLAALPENLPVSREEFSRLRMPTAHVTEIGFCIHDYTMSPCQLHRDCIRCDDLVCVKGDESKTDRVQKALENTVDLLRKAEDAVKAGYVGSNRWYDHHKEAADRLAQLHAVLIDPTVPDGAVVHLGAPKTLLHNDATLHLLGKRRGASE
ncbi:integrase [Pseudoduganella sp. RAF19]|uniref:integrase n=2 Tax=unclassified Pseudoduganella TaxID=2637179 RepID=UPI003F9B56D4